MTHDSDRLILQLANAACDGLLTASDATVLQLLVTSSPQQALRYLSFCELHARLAFILGQQNQGGDHEADDRLTDGTRRSMFLAEGFLPTFPGEAGGCVSPAGKINSKPQCRLPSSLPYVIAADRAACSAALTIETKRSAKMNGRPTFGIYSSSINCESVADRIAATYVFSP